MKATFGSIYSGIGGMDIGLERAGWRVLWQVESDQFRHAVLRKHWPVVRRFENILSVDPCGFDPVTLIAAGFPVSSFADPPLEFLSLLRVLRIVQPQFLLLETTIGKGTYKANVDALAIALRVAGYRRRVMRINVSLDDDTLYGREFVVGIRMTNTNGFRPMLKELHGQSLAIDGYHEAQNIVGRMLWEDVEEGENGLTVGTDWTCVCKKASCTCDRKERIQSLRDATHPDMAQMMGEMILEPEKAVRAILC